MPQPAKSKTDKIAAKPIEIFRSGAFVDAYKRKVEFTPEILARAAKIYDPALKAAPLQRGHASTSATPAVGWIASLAYDAAADRLRATPEKVALEFAEEVDAGAYRYVSAAFYQPDMSNNPAPGEYYLHHVAALGAAAPAVAGLQPISFSTSDEGELLVFTAPLEFGEDAEAAWRDGGIVAMFRRIKNFLIEKYGTDDADKAIPEYDLTWLTEASARAGERASMKERSSTGLAFAQPTQEIELTDKPNDEAEKLKKQLADRDAQLKELAFAENTRFAEGLVAARKLPSNQVPVVAALLTRLADTPDAEPLAFSETIDGKPVEKKIGAAAALKTMLGALPEMVDAGEAAKRMDALEAKAPVMFSAPAGYSVDPEQAALHAKAADYAAKHNVDFVEAYKAVGGR